MMPSTKGLVAKFSKHFSPWRRDGVIVLTPEILGGLINLISSEWACSRVGAIFDKLIAKCLAKGSEQRKHHQLEI